MDRFVCLGYFWVGVGGFRVVVFEFIVGWVGMWAVTRGWLVDGWCRRG